MVLPTTGVITASGGGYAISLSDANPQVVTPVYFLQPEEPTSALVTVVITNCDRGNNGPENCVTPSTYSVDPQPILYSRGAGTFTEANAQSAGDGTYIWDLPFATYVLRQQGWSYSYVINGTEYDGGTGYQFTISNNSPVTIYIQNINYVIGSTGGRN